MGNIEEKIIGWVFTIRVTNSDSFKDALKSIDRAVKRNYAKICLDISSIYNLKRDNIRYLIIASKKSRNEFVIMVNENVYRSLSVMKLNTTLNLIKKLDPSGIEPESE